MATYKSTMTFADVFDLQMGKTPSRDIPSYWSGDNVWVSIADMKDRKYVDSSKETISDEAIKTTGIREVQEGTVFMSFKLSIGKVAIAAKNLYTNEAIMQFPIKPGYELSPEYLYYYLLGHKWQGANKAVMGATLNKKKIAQEHISFPSIDDQQRIVDELDLLSNIIQKKNSQLSDLNALTTTYFYELFGDPVSNPCGWIRKRIGDIAQVKIGPFGSLLHKSDYVSGGTPLVNPVHMKDLRIVVDNDYSISDSKKQELNNYLLKEGDIVIARRGDIGRCAIVTAKDDGYLCGTGSMFVRPVVEIDSLFLVHLLSTKEMVRELLHQAKGVTMLNINCDIISNLSIIVPPIEEQNSYLSKIIALENQKQLILSSIQTTESLLNSRSEYYFAE